MQETEKMDGKWYARGQFKVFNTPSLFADYITNILLIIIIYINDLLDRF